MIPMLISMRQKKPTYTLPTSLYGSELRGLCPTSAEYVNNNLEISKRTWNVFNFPRRNCGLVEIASSKGEESLGRDLLTRFSPMCLPQARLHDWFRGA